MFEGQPKGLWSLALANTGERFGYYPMLAVFARRKSDILRKHFDKMAEIIVSTPMRNHRNRHIGDQQQTADRIIHESSHFLFS